MSGCPALIGAARSGQGSAAHGTLAAASRECHVSCTPSSVRLASHSDLTRVSPALHLPPCSWVAWTVVGCLGLVLAALSSGRLMRTAWRRRKVGSLHMSLCCVRVGAAVGCHAVACGCSATAQLFALLPHLRRPASSIRAAAQSLVSPAPHPRFTGPPHPCRPPRLGRSRRQAPPFCGTPATTAAWERGVSLRRAARVRDRALLQRRRRSSIWRQGVP